MTDFTALEQERLEKDLCLKCGKRITTQNYYGSLCAEHSQEYLTKDPCDKDHLDAEDFLAFCRDNKERVEFT
jgi:hypothetical protein